MHLKYSRMSRREFIRAVTLSCAAVPLIWVTADRALAQTKAPKEAVAYQDTPKDGKKCADCRFFTEPDGCQVVEGKISPEGWCSIFAAK